MDSPLIIGAGITGLCTAFFLNSKYMIIDQEATVGGSARSIQTNGFTFDFGEKFIRIPNNETEKFLFDLMGDNFFVQELKSAIFFKNKLINYPFQENLRELPIEELKICAKSLIQNYILNQKTSKKKFDNFEDFIYYNYGDYVANEFMIPYNEKIWAISPKKMNTQWFLSPNFIPSLNLDGILSSILPPSNIESPKKVRYYPKVGGSQAIANAFLPHVSNLVLNKKITQIDINSKKITLNDNSEMKYEKLINTMPLNELLQNITDLPKNIQSLIPKLLYNTVFCLNLGLNYRSNVKYHWLYFPQKEIPFSRLFFSSNFSENNAPNGCSTCSSLLTYLPGSNFDEKKISKKIIESLIQLGYIKDESHIIVRLPLTIKYGFTIPTLDLPNVWETINKFLIEHNIYSIGRYGAWKYSGIEHAIEDGKIIAQKFT